MTEHHEYEAKRPNSTMIFVLAAVLTLFMLADSYVGTRGGVAGREMPADTVVTNAPGISSF